MKGNTTNTLVFFPLARTLAALLVVAIISTLLAVLVFGLNIADGVCFGTADCLPFSIKRCLHVGFPSLLGVFGLDAFMRFEFAGCFDILKYLWWIPVRSTQVSNR